jgi:hypothetical protein
MRILIIIATFVLSIVVSSYAQSPASGAQGDIPQGSPGGSTLGSFNVQYQNQLRAVQPVAGVELSPPSWTVSYLNGLTKEPTFVEPGAQ